jgi:hypothetical protein
MFIKKTLKQVKKVAKLSEQEKKHINMNSIFYLIIKKHTSIKAIQVNIKYKI